MNVHVDEYQVYLVITEMFFKLPNLSKIALLPSYVPRNVTYVKRPIIPTCTRLYHAGYML